MGRAHAYAPLEADDITLIAACKSERDRIDAEIERMHAGDPKANFAAIQRLKRERAELSDERLAEKFETSKYQVFRV